MRKRVWTYSGNISSYSSGSNLEGETIIKEIELYDIDDDSKAPVLLHVSSSLIPYIMDIEWSDDEEKYMRKEFVYDSTMYIQKIQILNSKGQVCKIIENEDEYKWTATITGPVERINDRNQEALMPNAEKHLVGPENFR